MHHYQNIQMKCSNDANTLQILMERDRIFEPLAGLNVELIKLGFKF